MILKGGVRNIFRLAPLGAALLLSGCDIGVLDPKGPIAEANKTLLLDSVAIMLAIVIPTIVAVLAAAWWFRASNTRARYLPDFEYSGALELIVWAIPLLTIMLLGGVAWIGSHDLDPAVPIESKEDPLNIQVVSLDWKWLFIYPDQGVATVNQLVVPAGTPVSFRLTSATVWNSFFVPQMGSMIYTMPRMTTRLNLQANKPGVYNGLSSHFSGEGFAGMQFQVQALPADQFAMWADAAHASALKLDGAGYAQLSKPSSYVKPITYGAVAPGLYDAIVANRAPPNPVPAQQHNPPAPPAGA
jgi:cytochrome o ubiquinol oxidase subunit 2